MPNGIIVIDKPQDWTACGSSFSRRTRFAGLRREERGACYA